MWMLVLFLIFAASAACFWYLSARAARFALIRRWFPRRFAARAMGCVLVFAVFLICCAIFDAFNAIICILHAAVFFLIMDGIGLLTRRLTGKTARRYWAGGMAILLTILYLGWGYGCANRVRRTQYDLSTEKIIPDGELTIVEITDLHAGTTLTAKELDKCVSRVNAEEPDLVVLVGDLVDDDSTASDMEECCACLGDLQARYGVYYVFGNHDSGYRAHRGFDRDDLVYHLSANGITVLEDELLPVAEGLLVCGRRDLRASDRASMEELAQGRMEGEYLLVLDHEPGDFDAEAAAGADLVLCGHTHGGQMLPINHVGQWLGINDRTYGMERRGQTDFIVSSGISDWKLQFKTGCFSEYVVIHVQSAGKSGDE